MYVINIKVLLILLYCIWEGKSDYEPVIELGDDFDNWISNYEVVLAMFYAPWCGHCRMLKPEYVKAAEGLKYYDSSIIVAQVDCTTAGKNICDKYDIVSFPTIQLFLFGEMTSEYNGQRNAAGIVKFVTEHLIPTSLELESTEDLKQFLNDDGGIIGFFETESNLFINFVNVADKLRGKKRFGHTFNRKNMLIYGVETIVLFRPKYLTNIFENNIIVYKGDGSKDDIENFILSNYHGIVGHRKPDNVNDFPLPLVIAYFDVDYLRNIKGTNFWRNRILKIAKKFSNDFKFAISAKDDFQHELSPFRKFITGDKPIIIAKDTNNKYFIMKKEFLMDSFEQFLNSLKNKDIDPYIQSEPIPDSNDGPVKVAVGKTFENIVYDNGKDTFIYFHAPWCMRCKRFTPIFLELGEKMKSENIEMVMMDASNNYVPSLYKIHGLPLFYWAAKNQKTSPIMYINGGEIDDFIKYISKHSTEELRGYDREGKIKKNEL